MAMKRGCWGVRPCWTSTRTSSRKKGREHRDLRALLASNSKRARATCLEYSLVIFPSGHPSFLCSFISSLLSAWCLSDILFAKSLAAGCHCFLSYMRRNVASLEISCYRTMTARERGIKRREKISDWAKYILFHFYFRFVSFVCFFDGFISRLYSWPFFPSFHFFHFRDVPLWSFILTR